MSTTTSYNNEKSSDLEYGIDPASGGFFNSDYKKNDDLKQMLDVNKDSMKLEAMKRIIGMMAKGRDASDLFPSVVKNVVSKNIEIKKLVYVYLARYAEEQQDLALLSISTFQRGLKDPNQLIRASALRVLSSIRVPMIIPIVMLAIKDSSLDMSPYVRKTAAHAIPKLYSLDPDQKEELVLVIDKLLQDKTTLVVGSAVMAFEDVCPERIDMIHKNYRKLCNLLVDVDEWGQVIIINMLTRYARTQFTDPNLNDLESDELYEENSNKNFYDEEEIDKKLSKEKNQSSSIDSDHRLLLKNCSPLLQSRNGSVVMAVAQLFHHIAPSREVNIIAKSLVRLLRSSREVQSIVLTTIVTLSIKRKAMFVPYLKSFFVRSSDPTHVKLLKIEILTNLASESSISAILREFQTYISSNDKVFVAATVQAIGKCAANITQVTDTCLNGLVSLLSNRDEAVVAESVVVIKNLLQTQPQTHTDIIKHMVRLTDSITVAQARAAILWLLGEYSHLVPTLGPDVLRKMAKSFIQEEDIVKLQILNLAVKLYLTNPTQSNLLCQYVLSLARYDENYDIRDRVRLLRQLLFPISTEKKKENVFTKHAKKIFLVTKPAPIITSKYHDEDQFQMGSLSHHIKTKAHGYHELPPFSTVAPDPNLRTPSTPPMGRAEDPSIVEMKDKPNSINNNNKKAFYTSDSESTSGPEESDSDEDGSEIEETDDIENEEENDSEEDSSDEDDDDDESDSESNSDSEEEDKSKQKIQVKKTISTSQEKKKSSVVDKKSTSSNKVEATNGSTPSRPKSNLDLLLDLEDFSSSIGVPLITPTLGGFLTPSTSGTNLNSGIIPIPAVYTPPKYFEVLNKISSGRGMISVQASFTRQPCIHSTQMISIALRIENCCHLSLKNIKIDNSQIGYGMSLHPFTQIGNLSPGISTEVNIGVNFNDSTQPISPKLFWEVEGESESIFGILKFNSSAGELIKAVSMSQQLFDTEKNKLTGMNEHKGNLTSADKCPISPNLIYEIANLGPISSEDSILRMAGQSISSNCLILLTINQTEVIVNCEKMVLGSMLLNEILKHLN